MSNKRFTQTVITEVKTLKNDVNCVSFAVGQSKKCKCSSERSKGPKRQCLRKKNIKCESTFTCIDDKLGSENGRLKSCLKCSESKTSIEGACCSSQIKCSTRTGNTCNSLRHCPSSSHCRTTSSNNSRFPESSSACDEAGQAANNVAKNANSCHTHACDSKPHCCCTFSKHSDRSTCTDATRKPCRNKEYKKIWKKFKKVWSRKPKSERSFEKFCAQLFSNKAVNTCNSNVSLHYEMQTQCKTNACNSKINKAVSTQMAVLDIKLCQTSDTLLHCPIEKNNEKQEDNKELHSTSTNQKPKSRTSLLPNFSQMFSRNQKKEKLQECKNVDKQKNNVVNDGKAKTDAKVNENNVLLSPFTTSARESKTGTHEASTQHNSSSVSQSSKPSNNAPHNSSNNVGQSKQIEIQKNKMKRKVKIQNDVEKKTVSDKCESRLICVDNKSPDRSHCNCNCSKGKYCNY